MTKANWGATNGSGTGALQGCSLHTLTHTKWDCPDYSHDVTQNADVPNRHTAKGLTSTEGLQKLRQAQLIERKKRSLALCT